MRNLLIIALFLVLTPLFGLVGCSSGGGDSGAATPTGYTVSGKVSLASATAGVLGASVRGNIRAAATSDYSNMLVSLYFGFAEKTAVDVGPIRCDGNGAFNFGTITYTGPVRFVAVASSGARFHHYVDFLDSTTVSKLVSDTGSINDRNTLIGLLILNSGIATMTFAKMENSLTKDTASYTTAFLKWQQTLAGAKSGFDSVNADPGTLDPVVTQVINDAKGTTAPVVAPIVQPATVSLSRGNQTCTIIMHGFDPGITGEPAWTAAMQNAILARSGGTGKAGVITITGTKGNLTATCNPWTFTQDTDTTGDIVVRVNWSAVANHLTTGITAQEVAAAIAPKIYESQNGQHALAEMPIHLIGHSRGGGMVYELARLLGEKGVEVDHVTALDPHPLSSADTQNFFLGNVIDTPVKVYENVLFTDSYWQSYEYPKGEYVTGACNRLWSGQLTNGYYQATNTLLRTFGNHLNIILMYHGSIDVTRPASNGEATLNAADRTAWYNSYEALGAKTGFLYSRNLDESGRQTTVTPVDAGDQVKAGYSNNANLGGAGARQSLTWTGAVWPNVMTLSLLRNGTALGSGDQTITPGETLTIQYVYRDYDSASTITFFADSDRNPSNNNTVATIGSSTATVTGQVMTKGAFLWNTTGLSAPGKVYLYARISDGTRTRYIYW